MKNEMSGRRGFLLGLGSAALGLAAATSVLKPVQAAAEGCGELITPVQPQGPFYPIHDQLDKDNDLTRVTGISGQARGQLIYVRGQVSDQLCQPVAGALVEIWQACESGRYNHPGDPNTAPLDDHFQYWGQAVTNAKGEYVFKTIIPGAYPAGDGWVRPPHIHFKVSRVGARDLITQMYFAGQDLNDRDLILQDLPADEQAKVVVPLREPTSEFEPNSKIANFDIVLRRLTRG